MISPDPALEDTNRDLYLSDITIATMTYDFLIFLSALTGFLTHRVKIHGARFARLDELAGLLAAAFDKETSLILGVTRLKHVLRVKPRYTYDGDGPVWHGLQ